MLERFIEFREEAKKQGLGVDEAYDAAFEKVQAEHQAKFGSPSDAVADVVPVDAFEPDPDGDEVGPPAAVKTKKRASARQIVEYVFENMDNSGARLEDAPSVGAFSYLLYVRSTPAAKSAFYNDVWAKTLPKFQDTDTAGQERQVLVLDKLLAGLGELRASLDAEDAG